MLLLELRYLLMGLELRLEHRELAILLIHHLVVSHHRVIEHWIIHHLVIEHWIIHHLVVKHWATHHLIFQLLRLAVLNVLKLVFLLNFCFLSIVSFVLYFLLFLSFPVRIGNRILLRTIIIIIIVSISIIIIIFFWEMFKLFIESIRSITTFLFHDLVDLFWSDHILLG